MVTFNVVGVVGAVVGVVGSVVVVGVIGAVVIVGVVGAVVSAGVGVVGAGVGVVGAVVGTEDGFTGAGGGALKGVGLDVAVPKGRVPKDAPVVGVAAAVANGAVSALPLGSFPNNLINTALSSDSPNVSLDFCNLDIIFCT